MIGKLGILLSHKRHRSEAKMIVNAETALEAEAELEQQIKDLFNS